MRHGTRLETIPIVRRVSSPRLTPGPKTGEEPARPLGGHPPAGRDRAGEGELNLDWRRCDGPRATLKRSSGARRLHGNRNPKS